MAQGVTVKITGAAELKKNIQYLREHFPDWLNAANEASAIEVRDRAQSNLRELDAYDTHELHDTMAYAMFPNRFAAVVYSPATQAPYIELGTAPNRRPPPLDKIRAWCGRKGLPESAAFPIARAIAERGTPERPFLYPAFWAVMMHGHVQRIKASVGAGLRRIAA